ncbi:MAG: Dihydroorotate dehydrogenase B (NAD(+)), electron transfer subunit [Calditrichaeota bacterium]|nr:Dihydroorotate dehydrogenase B (NAD(+)), electron transfer subunit [Calditrichota bacterium]
MKHLEDAVVTRNRQIRPGIWSMWLRAPAVCAESRPGQFVHVRVGRDFHPLLRRPLSIGRVHEDELELVWRIVGRGTELMAEATEGDAVNLLGPLGRPFTIDTDAEGRILIAGGLGLPPLVYLLESFRERWKKASLLLGVRGRDDIPLAEDDPLLREVEVVAERGDGYRRGIVTDPAAEWLTRREHDGGLENVALYACGPWGLVRALQGLIPANRLRRAEVSLEQQMGCASGVCQGCAVEVEDGDTPYRLVCTDGPVFPLHAVHAPALV